MSDYHPAFLRMMTGQGDMSYLMPLIHRMVLDRFTHRPDSTLVELGVRGGNSTISILSALAEINNGSKLHSCDLDACDSIYQHIPPQLMLHWRFSQMDSCLMAKLFRMESVAFLFVDTDHTFGQTHKELAAWRDRLAPGARVLLHDTLSTDGVSKAIAEFRTEVPGTKYYNIDACHGLGVLDMP